MIIRQLAFAGALAGFCMGCCDDTFAQSEQLHFTNNTTVPVVITDLTRDDTVSHMPSHTIAVAVGQEVTWSVDFADRNPLTPDDDESDTGYLAHGLYQLDVLVHHQIACEWLYTYKQDCPHHSHANSIFNIMMPGFNFEEDDADPSTLIDLPPKLVLIEDQEANDFIHNVLHDNY